MVRRQRLGLEHIQHRARQMPAVQRRASGPASLQWPPRADIHHPGALGQSGEQLGIHDALGLGRQRQHADQDIALGQEARAVPAARQSWSRRARLLRLRLQPKTWKSNISSRSAVTAPISPIPRMPMRNSREGRASMRCCQTLSLLRGVEGALAGDG